MADFFHFIPGYKHYVYGPGREPLFFLLLAFLLTFAVARTYTRMGRLHGWRSGSVRGVHLHHLVPGIIASLAAGTAIIAFRPGDDSMLMLSALFGVGAALTLDEFALWLHLRDVYWEREGRASVDATFLFGALISAGFWGGPFLGAIGREMNGRQPGNGPASPRPLPALMLIRRINIIHPVDKR